MKYMLSQVMKSSVKFVPMLMGILAAMSWWLPAKAQQTSAASTSGGAQGAEIQEIVVTAQRRKENLQDVPISVAAFSAGQLEATGVSNTADLPMVTPGLVFGQQAGYAQPFLRGVGTVALSPGLENPIATYVDDVYYGPVFGAIMSFSNVEQVEVDKGPQGTLFGRNATGGLIQVKTKDPEQEFGGTVSATYGNYRTVGSDAYVTGGLTSDLAADLAVHYLNQADGYGKNLYNGEDIDRTREVALRNKWLFKPSDGTEVKVILDWERDNSNAAYISAPGTIPLGGPIYNGGNPQNIDSLVQPFGVADQWGASLHLIQNVGFADFVSTTAYRHLETDFEGAATLTANPLYTIDAIIHELHHQFSQEFQLVAPEHSRIQWATGAFFYDSLSAWQPSVATGGLVAPYDYGQNYSDQRAVSGALFGQATMEVLPATNLTLGARYTYERRNIYSSEDYVASPPYEAYSFSIVDRAEPALIFKKPTWRFSLDHRFTPDLMGYISYNRGFKSGGWNDIVVPSSAYLPETLDAYEAGVKSDFFAHRVQVNASTFLYNYKNMQNAIFYQASEIIYNSASARIYGVDLDTKLAVTRHLALTVAGEWLHDAYTSFPNANFSMPIMGGGTAYTTQSAAGHHLPLAPDASFSVGADYTVESAIGNLTFNVTDAYSSGWFAEPDNRLHQPSYNLFNSRASWSPMDSSVTVSLWGKNLTNKDYLTALGSQTNGDFAAIAPPRTYGVTASKKF